MKKTQAVLFVFLAAALAVLYRPVLGYPFFGDDWFVLSCVESEGFSRAMDFFWSVRAGNAVSYRPLGDTWVGLFYSLFGLNYPLFHFLSLLLHAVNSLWVVLIARRFGLDHFSAWAAGFIYGGAVYIHLFPLAWATGTYELWGAFFLLGMIFLWLRGAPAPSAVFYALALLSKASTGLMPLVCLVHALAVERKSFPRVLFFLRWHALVLAVYGCVWAVDLFTHHGGEGSYRLEWFYPLMADKLLSYCRDAAAAFYPTVLRWPLLAAAAGAGVLPFLLPRRVFDRLVPADARCARCLVLAVWFAAGLYPALVLPHTYNRYYLSFSWGAVSIFSVLVLKASGLGLLGRVKNLWAAAPAFLVLCLWLSSGDYLREQNRRGTGSSDNAVECASRLSFYEREIRRSLPLPEKGAVLLFFGDDPTWIFRSASLAPRVWFRDPSVEVCTPSEIDVNAGGGLFITRAGVLPCRTLFAPLSAGRPFYVFRFRGGALDMARADYGLMRRFAASRVRQPEFFFGGL